MNTSTAASLDSRQQQAAATEISLSPSLISNVGSYQYHILQSPSRPIHNQRVTSSYLIPNQKMRLLLQSQLITTCLLAPVIAQLPTLSPAPTADPTLIVTLPGTEISTLPIFPASPAVSYSYCLVCISILICVLHAHLLL